MCLLLSHLFCFFSFERRKERNVDSCPSIRAGFPPTHPPIWHWHVWLFQFPVISFPFNYSIRNCSAVKKITHKNNLLKKWNEKKNNSVSKNPCRASIFHQQENLFLKMNKKKISKTCGSMPPIVTVIVMTTALIPTNCHPGRRSDTKKKSASYPLRLPPSNSRIAQRCCINILHDLFKKKNEKQKKKK